jgi:hypothetical protein
MFAKGERTTLIHIEDLSNQNIKAKPSKHQSSSEILSCSMLPHSFVNKQAHSSKTTIILQLYHACRHHHFRSSADIAK